MSQQGFRGSCACGRITFKVSEPPRRITYCYCIQCAKASGAGYLPFAAVSVDNVAWSRQPDIWESSKVAERGFCASCGSALSMRYYQDNNEIGLALSAIDQCETPFPPPQKHIFLKEKAAWVMVPEDGADRYDLHETTFQQQFDSWKDETTQ